MTSPNSHIKDFLDYYCTSSYDLGYAVLLKGKWGAGKTWFIKQYFQQREEKGKEVKHLYVSLYGMTSFAEIEDELFKQLHPVLSSKSLALTRKIAKGLLKASLKIDLDNDGKADGSVSSQMPEIKLSEYLTNTDDFVIIFDDLERAAIELDSLLGYINYYVEHQGHKVIILANEEEILVSQASLGSQKQSSSQHAFRRIKEKLIGKTFAIEPDLQGALTSFIDDIDDGDAKKLYEENVELIAQLYIESGYQNLRLLKQSLWDFERLFHVLSDDAENKEAMLQHLLKLFLVLSFEINSGSLDAADIAEFSSAPLMATLLQQEENREESDYEKIHKKYHHINLSELLLEESIWEEVLSKGYCSKEKIQASLEKSKYYDTRPDWVKLCNFMELKDKQFDVVLASVEQDFIKRTFREVDIVLHVTGIFLRFSTAGVISINKFEIFARALSYIDFFKRKGALISDSFYSRDNYSKKTLYESQGFHAEDLQDFRVLIDRIDEIRKDALIEHYSASDNEFFDLIARDPKVLYLSLTDYVDLTHNDKIILRYIKPEAFISAFINAGDDGRRLTSKAIRERYHHSRDKGLLLSELAWLETVVQLLEQEIQQRKDKLSGYQLQSYLTHYFRAAVDELKKFTESNSTPS